MLDDNGVPVLMDLGSTNTARVEIKTRTEAQALQVICKIEPRCKKTGLQGFRPDTKQSVQPQKIARNLKFQT